MSRRINEKEWNGIMEVMTANAATGKLSVMGVKGCEVVTNVFRL